MPPAPSMIGISAHDVVGLELGLDDEVDMPGREHAIGVAIAAVAREPHRALDACEGGAVAAFISSGLVVNSIASPSDAQARTCRSRSPAGPR